MTTKIHRKEEIIATSNSSNQSLYTIFHLYEIVYLLNKVNEKQKYEIVKAPKMAQYSNYGDDEEFVDEIILDDKGGEAVGDCDFNQSIDSDKLSKNSPRTLFK